MILRATSHSTQASPIRSAAAQTVLLALAFVFWCLQASTALAAEAAETEESVDVTSGEPAAVLRQADENFQRYAASRDRIRFRTILRPDALYLAEELHRGFGPALHAWNPLWNEKDGFSYRGEVLNVTVAESGDLGFTVGNVETRFRPPVDAEDRVQSGSYLTVWRSESQPGGPQDWKVAASGPLVVHPTLGESRDPRGALMTAWPELSGRIGAELEIHWTPETTVVAESGELAYVFGAYAADFSTPDQGVDAGRAGGGTGHFLAVWQKDGAGRWQLAAESMTPPKAN